MADVNISGLSAASTLTGAELVEVMQGGVNKKTTVAEITGFYLVYTALLTEDGTDAPVATVLQNSLGVASPTWVRASAGVYNAKTALAWVANKAYASGFGNWGDSGNPYMPISNGGAILGYYTCYPYEYNDGDGNRLAISLQTVDESFAAADLSTLIGNGDDGAILFLPEIRVYP